ncbi:MAG: CapA family protein [Noviherbaspirillum sp.]
MGDTDPETDESWRILFGGDVMLGRMVKEVILRHGPGYPLRPVAHILRSADLSIVNLECAITSCDEQWPGAPKAFYFGAPPAAVASLLDAGVDLVSLANNHVLDYGVDGLRETLALLRQHGIRAAGAGLDSAAAAKPCILHRGELALGMAAFCDHQADFAAGASRPGIAYIDLEDAPAALTRLRAALAPLQQAAVDWPVLSLHWGPNLLMRPSAGFRRIAHAAIDMGWKIIFGHSAHVFQGIEVYRGCPILYAAGDLVDDYYVYPEWRNDLQLMFELVLTRAALRRIVLHPVRIHDCQARPGLPMARHMAPLPVACRRCAVKWVRSCSSIPNRSG